MPKGKQAQRGIPEPTIPDRQLQISFKHLECEDERYPLDTCTSEYWILLVQELKRYASFSVSQFEDPDDTYARHLIDPEDERVDSADFLRLMDEFEWSAVWQFGLGQKSKGFRVIGILVDPIFFVIRLDANHQTYVRKEGGGYTW